MSSRDVKTSVLFVCLGNICRSPLAEGVFRREVERRDLASELAVDSCGTSSYHVGERPDRRGQKVAAKNGVDISDLASRQVRRDDFERFDWLVAMDRSNARELERMKPAGSRGRVVRFMDYVPDAPGPDVPDPYYGGPQGFDVVFELLERGAGPLLDAVVAER